MHQIVGVSNVTIITDSSSPHNLHFSSNYTDCLSGSLIFSCLLAHPYAWMTIIVVLMCHVCNFLFQFCEAYFSGKESAGPSFAEHARRGRGHRVRTGSGVRSGGKQQLDDPANHASIPGSTACTSYWTTQQDYNIIVLCTCRASKSIRCIQLLLAMTHCVSQLCIIIYACTVDPRSYRDSNSYRAFSFYVISHVTMK